MSVGSTTYTGWSPYIPAAGQVSAERPYSSYNPSLDPVDPTMSCNDDGTSSAGQQSITIAAGDTIVAYWAQWTHAQGPVTVYMAACGGTTCTGVNSDTLSWFKISEMGLISGTVYNGSWANGILMANLKWPATIPSNLKPGPYLIRFETLALHQADTPQFYPECIQLIVTGSGTAFPTADYLKPIPGAWTATDPGVLIDIYSTAAQTETTYQIPGPPIYPGFSGISTGTTTTGTTGTTGTTTTTKSSTTSTKTSSTSTTSSKTTTTTTTTTSASGATQTHYGQCGGTGYSGPTVCASPYTCTYSSAYYSQCL